MKFGTSIHCMDGRIQEPIRKYLKDNYSITYVDTITEPGPCKILAEKVNVRVVNSILNKANISVQIHDSKLISISGHYDCAGNPSDEEIQKAQIKKSVEYLTNRYPNIEIIGLWIDKNWQVHRIPIITKT